MKQVKEIMSKNLITASPDQSVGELRRLMTRYHVGALPIRNKEDKAQVVGIVTDMDLRNIKDPDLPASAVMTTVLHYISQNASASAAANVMLQYGIHHLLVKEQDELVGLLSSLDLLTLISETQVPMANRMVFT